MASFENGIPTLTSGEQRVLQKAVQEQLGNLVFRRVSRVFAPRREFKNGIQYEFDIGCSRERSRIYWDLAKIPKDTDVLHKEWEVRYKRFYGFADCGGPYGLRDSDPCPRKEVYFNSTRYAELDIVKECTLGFRHFCNQKVRPMVGDLICGVIEDPSSKKPQFAKWFNCSEQFFRAWTLIMYHQHDSYKRKTEARLKEFSLSGNRLSTNSFLKWIMACRDNRKPIRQEEVDQRHYHLRTEYVSRQWIHSYAALVLMVRWGELPCKYNIPSNRDDSPNMMHWNLPGRFITSFLKKWTSRKPEDWGCKNWPDLELAIRERREELLKVPEPSGPLKFTPSEFPALSDKAIVSVSKPVWRIKPGPVEPPENQVISDLFDRMHSSSDSWADLMDEEEENQNVKECMELTNDKEAEREAIAQLREMAFSIDDPPSDNSEPSEGGDHRTVHLVYSLGKDYVELMEVLGSAEKAQRYLEDWVKLRTQDGHWGDTVRHDSDPNKCELCELRKFKTLKSLEEKGEAELWDGRKGYIEEREVM